MEIIGIVILNYVFGLLGAVFRFAIINLNSRPVTVFKEIWRDKKAKNGKYDNYLLNVLTGAVLFFIFATLAIKFGW